MPDAFWTEAARMAGCGLRVAAGAVPFGLLAWWLCRRAAIPILPRPGRWVAPWGGFELFIVFAFSVAAPMGLVDPILGGTGFYRAVYGSEMLEKEWSPMRPLWSAAIFAPLWIGSLALGARLAYPRWRPARTSSIGNIAAGVGAWPAIHLVVALVHFAVLSSFLALEWKPDSHPLEQSFKEGRVRVDEALFVVQAAVTAPWLEETLFRGALLPWLLGRRWRSGLVMVIALLFAIAESASSSELGPLYFALMLFTGGAVLRAKVRRHRRTIGAIYSSATLFAVVHSSVWPTPIPLFVLGLGLGWLAVRTRSILAPTVVHALFNLVSVLFVLRGG